MRVKRPALILVSAAGVALGAVAIGWKAQAGGPKTRTGTFANGMEYAVLGSGPKTLLMIPGGPGSAVPSGFEIRMMAGSIQPFLEGWLHRLGRHPSPPDAHRPHLRRHG